ncbi:mucin-1-like, partial [Oncorhynchus keta]|uniref:mucin-1-like n=1 Tax=Oncorhynchus keta TaxID=8018 RepID=UPI00227A8168
EIGERIHSSFKAPQQQGIHSPFKAPQQQGIHSPFKAPPQQGIHSPFKAPQQQGIHSPFKAPQQQGIHSPFKAPQQQGIHSPFKAPQQQGIHSPFKASQQQGIHSPFKAPQQQGIHSPFKASQQQGIHSPFKASQQQGINSPFKASQQQGIHSPFKAPSRQGGSTATPSPQAPPQQGIHSPFKAPPPTGDPQPLQGIIPAGKYNPFKAPSRNREDPQPHPGTTPAGDTQPPSPAGRSTAPSRHRNIRGYTAPRHHPSRGSTVPSRHHPGREEVQPFKASSRQGRNPQPLPGIIPPGEEDPQPHPRHPKQGCTAPARYRPSRMHSPTQAPPQQGMHSPHPGTSSRGKPHPGTAQHFKAPQHQGIHSPTTGDPPLQGIIPAGRKYSPFKDTSSHTQVPPQQVIPSHLPQQGRSTTPPAPTRHPPQQGDAQPHPGTAPSRMHSPTQVPPQQGMPGDIQVPPQQVIPSHRPSREDPQPHQGTASSRMHSPTQAPSRGCTAPPRLAPAGDAQGGYPASPTAPPGTAQHCPTRGYRTQASGDPQPAPVGATRHPGTAPVGDSPTQAPSRGIIPGRGDTSPTQAAPVGIQPTQARDTAPPRHRPVGDTQPHPGTGKDYTAPPRHRPRGYHPRQVTASPRHRPSRGYTAPPRHSPLQPHPGTAPVGDTTPQAPPRQYTAPPRHCPTGDSPTQAPQHHQQGQPQHHPNRGRNLQGTIPTKAPGLPQQGRSTAPSRHRNIRIHSPQAPPAGIHSPFKASSRQGGSTLQGTIPAGGSTATSSTTLQVIPSHRPAGKIHSPTKAGGCTAPTQDAPVRSRMHSPTQAPGYAQHRGCTALQGTTPTGDPPLQGIIPASPFKDPGTEGHPGTTPAGDTQPPSPAGKIHNPTKAPSRGCTAPPGQGMHSPTQVPPSRGCTAPPRYRPSRGCTGGHPGTTPAGTAPSRGSTAPRHRAPGTRLQQGIHPARGCHIQAQQVIPSHRPSRKIHSPTQGTAQAGDAQPHPATAPAGKIHSPTKAPPKQGMHSPTQVPPQQGMQASQFQVPPSRGCTGTSRYHPQVIPRHTAPPVGDAQPHPGTRPAGGYSPTQAQPQQGMHSPTQAAPRGMQHILHPGTAQQGYTALQGTTPTGDPQHLQGIIPGREEVQPFKAQPDRGIQPHPGTAQGIHQVLQGHHPRHRPPVGDTSPNQALPQGTQPHPAGRIHSHIQVPPQQVIPSHRPTGKIHSPTKAPPKQMHQHPGASPSRGCTAPPQAPPQQGMHRPALQAPLQ